MFKKNVSRARQNVKNVKIGVSKSYILVICLLKNNFNLRVFPGYAFFTFLGGFWTPPTLKTNGFTYVKQYFFEIPPNRFRVAYGGILAPFWQPKSSQNLFFWWSTFQ